MRRSRPERAGKGAGRKGVRAQFEKGVRAQFRGEPSDSPGGPSDSAPDAGHPARGPSDSASDAGASVDETEALGGAIDAGDAVDENEAGTGADADTGAYPDTDADADADTAAGIDGDATRLDPAECERRAVALLARREHSRRELERKLSARGFPPAVVAETLDRLEQNGVLSGQRFMASFIASRAERGSGPAKIRAELAQRGIRPDEAAAALRAAGEDWTELARRARTKRFGEPPPRDYAERARQARFLRGRGFDPEHIDAALEVGADSD